MAPIAPNIDEAPSSPRSAALYYWGGGGNNCNDKNNDHDVNGSTLREYTSYESIGSGYRRHQHHHRRPLIKFHLQMDDEDDCNHWMLPRKSVPVQVVVSPANNYVAADTNNFVESTSPEEEEGQSPSKHVPEGTTKDGFGSEERSNEDFESIPIIDLNQPLEQYAKQIGDACRETGFFYIINHGIEESVMNDVMGASKRLFALDLESKVALSASTEEASEKKGYRGYFGIGAEDLDNKDGTRDLASEEQQHGLKKTLASRGDFKEGFDVGLEHQHMNDVDDDNNVCHSFFGGNIWPDEKKHESLTGFRTTLLRYQDELLKLADKLMVALAISLRSLPPDYFLKCTRNPMCTLRLLHYPPSSNASSNSGCGAGAHTDYGLFTILRQDHIGGLQVRNHGKKWINAKPLRGSFIINVGDMLSHWSRGFYASTVHRVISPSNNSDHRYSVPFFFNPDHDAVIEPIIVDDACSERSIGEERSTGRNALEILMGRYEGTFE